MKKYGTGKQATDNNITRRMRFECYITKATDIHSEYVILNCFSNAKNITRTHLGITFILMLPLWLDRISEFKVSVV